MGEPESSRTQVLAEAGDAAQAAISSEIESVVLTRVAAAGGNLAQLARIRAFYGAAMGVVSWVSDIIEMAQAGFHSMTAPRQKVMRVSAAHGFGYWVFQHTSIHNPINPPNSFLVMHRKRDQFDRGIAQRTNNPNFSTDGGLTSADWNIIWRQGVQGSTGGVQSQLMELARRGRLQPVLEELLGPHANVRGQSNEAIVNQYRVLVMCPKFGSPSAAAGSFFLSSLADVTSELERDMGLRLYRQFPYNPVVSS